MLIHRHFIYSILLGDLFLILLSVDQNEAKVNSSLNDNTPTKSPKNNWAVLVSTSKYWFNYRHSANVLSIYRSIKRLGIDDAHIILMLADDMACDARNPWPGSIFNNAHHHINVYGSDVEVDYRGDEVTVENFIRLLTGRHHDATPRSKRLFSDEDSNILIYLTGHGGNGFLKFRDKDELTALEIANSFEQMYQKKRYNEILFIIDSCQAESMSNLLYSPNIIGIGSSKIGQDSLSHHGDSSIGVYVIDRYTYYVLNFLEKLDIVKSQNTSMSEFFRVCPENVCMSTVKIRLDLYERDTNKVPISDFFGNKVHHRLFSIKEDPLWMNML